MTTHMTMTLCMRSTTGSGVDEMYSSSRAAGIKLRALKKLFLNEN